MTAAPASTLRTAWRAVVGFGLVSLAGDMVYEGARSTYGPLLASLGASALVVGLVTGLGEAMSLVLRLASGPLADQTRRYWGFTIIGYGLTAVCVPLLAVTPFLGAAGLAVASLLILTERTGKAVRSPSKTALLAGAARAVGSGRGFGVHKALDETGAFAGPLLVAGVLALSFGRWGSGQIWLAMLVLAVPGLVAMVTLLVLRRRVPDPGVLSGEPMADLPPPAPITIRSWWRDTFGLGLPRQFFLFAACCGLATAGLVTFGVIGYHLSTAHVLALAAIPVAYAFGQLASALAALATGFSYDRVGAKVLFVLPVLIALVPVLAFTRSPWVAVAGVLLWGAANGLQDSTVKALVADLVEKPRLATAYGVFAAIQGGAAVLGGGVSGWLYERSVPALIVVVTITQVATAALLAATILGRRGEAAE